MVRLFACLGLLLLGYVTPAHAIVAETIFDFAGTCSDCAGTSYATLTVQGSYVQGTDITTNNFVSFTYAGTNLLSGFTITDAQVENDGDVGGAIGPGLPGPFEFYIGFFNNQTENFFDFDSYVDGFWCVGNSCGDDLGPTHLWSLPSASNVPEPLSLAILASGLVALGGARRRRASPS